MRIFVLLVLLVYAPIFIYGQLNNEPIAAHIPKHSIQINPLNILLFQQAGITYEYKPGIMAFAITSGYIYPNRKEYSNYFIAGPTNTGSLGDYSGFFIVPQMNIFLNIPKVLRHEGEGYFAFKMVYKNMYIDSTELTAGHNEGNGYQTFNKMIDKVKIYGGFIDFGYRYVLKHFFYDFNLGLGPMWVNHEMIISGQAYPKINSRIHYFNPPRLAEVHEFHMTINLTFNMGIAF
jgi:hypothetical protein